MAEELRTAGTTRRDVLTKAVFVAPAILTLTAVPAFASAGSSTGRDDGQHGGHQDNDQHTKPKKPEKHLRYGNFGD